MINSYTYNTYIGDFTICEEDNFIIEMTCKESKYKSDSHNESALIKNAYNQLDEYLKGKRKNFVLPLNPKGTEFQKKVWKALIEIPYGTTCSYKDIAIKIGNEKASRAVGGANNKNPICIFIPCHRVIGADGNLVGYAGGTEVKKMLLDLEKNNSL